MKKTVSLFLALAVICLLSSVTAFANQDFIVTYTEGGTVSVLSDTDTQKQVRADPSEGYEFAYWYYTVYDGAEMTSTENPELFDKYENATRTVQAVFSRKKCNISALATQGGSTVGGGTYDIGSSVTLVANPEDGYEFSCWKNGENILSYSQTWTTTAVGDITYTAVFTGKKSTITASVDPSGAGYINSQSSYTETISFESGKVLPLTAQPVLGYEFDGWYENGNKISSSASEIFDTNRDRSLTAKFNVVNTAPSTVDPEPINHFPPVPSEFQSGTQLQKYTITYFPGKFSVGVPYTSEWYIGSAYLYGQTYTRTGYVQTGWTEIDGGAIKQYNLNSPITINRNMVLYPYWEYVSNPLYLTVTTTPGGSVRLNGSNVASGWSYKLEPNQSLTFYFYPNQDYYVYSLNLAGRYRQIENGNIFRVTYEMLEGRNQALSIKFADRWSSPKTGDDSDLALWTAFFLMSGISLSAACVARKRNKT